MNKQEKTIILEVIAILGGVGEILTGLISGE